MTSSFNSFRPLAQRSLRLQPLQPFTARYSTTRPLQSRLRQPGEPTGPNEPPSHTTSPNSKSPIKVWPIVAILGVGTFLFKKIVDDRKGTYNAADKPVSGHSPARP